MLYQLFWLFLAFSFLGWCLEVAATAVRLGQYRDRGVLHGPLCLVYGITGCLITIALRELSGGQRGAQQINDQQNGKDPQQNMRKPGGYQLVQTHQQRHQPLDGYQAHFLPHYRWVLDEPFQPGVGTFLYCLGPCHCAGHPGFVQVQRPFGILAVRHGHPVGRCL